MLYYCNFSFTSAFITFVAHFSTVITLIWETVFTCSRGSVPNAKPYTEFLLLLCSFSKRALTKFNVNLLRCSNHCLINGKQHHNLPHVH